MNKVFDVSNVCGVNIYYQDTDSINLNYDDVCQIVNTNISKHISTI